MHLVKKVSSVRLEKFFVFERKMDKDESFIIHCSFGSSTDLVSKMDDVTCSNNCAVSTVHVYCEEKDEFSVIPFSNA